MRLLPVLAFASVALPACYVEVDDPGPPPGPVNYAPTFDWADAGCWWDPYEYDFIWTFEAGVWDPDGIGDIAEVYVDVYDTWDGTWQDGFMLYPDAYELTFWYSDWVERSTYLYCDYPGYVIDFTVVDYSGAYEVVSVNPYQQW